jgi:hypothetical protein
MNWTPYVFGHHIPRHFKLCSFLLWERYCVFIRKVRVPCCVCRKGTGPPKSDDGNKKDDDKDHIPVREFEEDTNDRYAAYGDKNVFWFVYLHAALKISLHYVSGDCLLCR